eukprot:Seg402.7 transcript_id=Seg402.7/GoldUCD/mRNA.D3Y31 product="Sarcoplasmic reticulum histidine-rich calcium-binding protein" protein_id=Seg402.7/GoldUCD/D3Y31
MAQIEYLLKLILLIGISLVLICSGEKQAAQDHPQPAGEAQAATSSTASQEDVPSDTGKPPLADQGDQLNADSSSDDVDISTEEGKNPDPSEKNEPETYGEGSVCVYCQYCKFCKLCDKDCPCKKSKKKPNCHMCKYCKYCYLCSKVCDNFCKPGSFLDTISSAIWSALPKFDSKMKGEVDKDIDSVKDWIKSYL